MTPNEIAALTGQEANQLLHESSLVGKCWHRGFKPLVMSTVGHLSRTQSTCCMCDVVFDEKEIVDEVGNPNYAQDWNVIIPVVQSLRNHYVNTKEKRVDLVSDFEEIIFKMVGEEWHNYTTGVLTLESRDLLNALLELVRGNNENNQID